VGIVTRNARKTINRYIEDYNIGPWNMWEFGPDMVEDMSVYGKRTDYRMLVATCKILNVDFEIIEPLDDKSIYYDFLTLHGEGIQHINYDAIDYDKTLEYFKENNISVTQFGNLLGKHRYIYFDTEQDTGHVIETSGNLPGLKRREPLETFPTGGKTGTDRTGLSFNGISQIGIIVQDMDRISKTLNDKYMIGPWDFFSINDKTATGMEVLGKEADFSYKVAVYKLEDVELALVMPEEGISIFSDFSRTGRQGPFYITFEVDDYQNALEAAFDMGISERQCFSWRDRKISFLDTRRDLGFVTCIGE
jgi:hypothetical protein